MNIKEGIKPTLSFKKKKNKRERERGREKVGQLLSFSDFEVLKRGAGGSLFERIGNCVRFSSGVRDKE